MAILNTNHLLEQADRLATPASSGRPRQVDLRRAISSAYYAVFHAAITGAADEIAGAVVRGSREHGLVMRSIDHRTIKLCCTEIMKSTPPKSYLAYRPKAGFGADVSTYADLFPDLQEQRHAADYDSLISYRTADALSVIATAHQAIDALSRADISDRRAFFYLITFPPKR